jgi:hypothetical protein
MTERTTGELAKLARLPSKLPADFEMLAATDAQLAKYGLPPRPDSKASPKSYALWKDILSPKKQLLQPAFSVAAPSPEAWITSSSDNWSGAVIRAPAAARFARVEATWTVPRPYPQERQAPNGPWTDGEYRSSTWIGLDGFDETSAAMPQVGTAQFVKASGNVLTVDTHVWFQWWVRAEATPTGPSRIDNLPVLPGDMIYCQLVARTPDEVSVLIVNLSTGLQTVFSVPAPHKPGSAEQVTIEGRTAEWVMERPRPLNDPQGFFTLPNYGATFFSSCFAATTNGSVQKLTGAEMISMSDATGTLSSAVPSGDDSLLVFYRSFGPNL